jgi:hypothetical protein
MTTVSNDTQWPDSRTFDGRCDLLDFFPLWLDMEGLPSGAPADGNWTLRLSQADSAVQVVYTDLCADGAGAYLVSDVSGCGQGFAQAAHEAQTLRVGADGIGLEPAFLSRIVASP